jgi:hypothetical protein
MPSPSKEQAEIAFNTVYQAARAALLSADNHQSVAMALNCIKALIEEAYKEETKETPNV